MRFFERVCPEVQGVQIMPRFIFSVAEDFDAVRNRIQAK